MEYVSGAIVMFLFIWPLFYHYRTEALHYKQRLEQSERRFAEFCVAEKVTNYDLSQL